MARESNFDDEADFLDDELANTALEAFERRRKNARGRIDFRRLVEQKLELKILRDELDLYLISGEDSELEIH